MTLQIGITLGVILLALIFFVWNKVPAAAVAVCAALVLYLTGVNTAEQTLAGLGDQVVVLLVGLFSIAVALENAGVAAWAGQVLMRRTGKSPIVRLIAIMVVAAVFSGLVGMNGAVAAMIPIVTVVALRTDTPPSKLMIPLAFACLTGAKLTLLGTPVNVITATQAEEAGVGHIGFFAWALIGIPLLAGTILITVVSLRLLPVRRSETIPSDFSAHAQTLVEEYRLERGLHRLRIRASSPLVGSRPEAIDLAPYPGLSVVTSLAAQTGAPLARDAFEEGDILLVRGDADQIGRLATDQHLGVRETDDSVPVAELLMSRESGLAEVIIPPRSKLIGRQVFPGMSTEDGGLMILAVQRGGQEIAHDRTTLRVGDHLLLQGAWNAIDGYLADPQVLVVDSPEVVRRQAVALGKGAPQAIAILVLLVVLLAFNLMPAALAAVLCATLMVLTRVVTVQQLFRGIDWNTCILIGAMIPPAIAMSHTGAAALIGDGVVGALGGWGPYAVMGGLFLVSAVLTQFISNTSTSLVMLPIGLATAGELGVSALPMMLAVAMGASSSYLTPFANGVSLMAFGPGGYRFGDFWRLGLLVLAWTFLVTLVVVPVFWPF